MKINGSLKFDASGLSQIENLRVEKLASLSSWGSADVGRLVYITGTQTIYVGGASAWISVATGGNAAALQTEVDAIESSLGSIVDTSGVWQVNALGSYPALTGEEESLTEVLQAILAYATGKDELSELSDVSLTSVTDKDLLQYNDTSGKWENEVIGSASGVQAWDAGLDSLAALSGTGIVVETADGEFANRTLVAPAAGITITNADGVSGNPTLVLANDLAALEGLTTTGYVVRTGNGTATTRAIAGTAGNISVTNGDGVASDTTVNLATVSQGASGSFVKVTLDGFGRVTANTAVVASDITALVDATYVNVSGDTMTGSLTMGTGTHITLTDTPVSGTDAANKAYVDALQNGLSWKQAVRVATTGNVDLASAASGYDGVTLTSGDRVLVKSQTAPAENGIYVFNGTGNALTRATDMDSAAEFDGSAVFVYEGTVNEGSGWTETATVATVDTDDVVFSQFTGGAVYIWGTGLSTSGNTVSVNLGAGIAQLPSDEVGIDLYAESASALVLTTDSGATSSTNTAAKLFLRLDAAGGLEQGTSGLLIGETGVTNAMLVNSTVGLNADTGSSTLALGETLEVVGDATQGIVTSVTDQTVTVTADDATDTQKGVAKFSSTNFTVTAGNVVLDTSIGSLNNVDDAVDTAVTDSLLVTTGTGDWTSTTREDFFNATSVDALSDVTVTSAAAGDVLVNDGAGQFVNRQIYFLYSGASSATHTVTHNLGQKYCNVTVVDSTDNVVIPESIVFDTANQLTVTFNSAIAAKVVVMGV